MEIYLDPKYYIPTDRIRIRDPFIVACKEKNLYYLFGTTDSDPWKGKGEGFLVYESKDLTFWSDPQYAFVPPDGFWATHQFWAPEVHFYRKHWYMLASFKSPNRCRGVQILCSDCITGPYLPITSGPITPSDWECLDGTLYIDNNDTPWIVFSHEWTQIGNGALYAAPLSEDLSTINGKPVLLFHANDAPWSAPNTGDMVVKEGNNYVTDGPFLYHDTIGTLHMIWSSFSDLGYALGVSTSISGKITGPWTHSSNPLFNSGGHGMLFKDFNGQTFLALHSPNTDMLERLKLIPFEV